jgi:hypothetical protein
MNPTTKTTTDSSPPKWSQPLFTQSASEAQKIYNSGAGGNVYQGQTVAGLGNTTQAGINGVQQAAGAYGQKPSYLTDPTSSGQNLGDMASGKYLQQGNPYFNQALQGQLDNTANQVQSQFSGAGRYGSGANTNALTSQLGNIRSSALSNQFNQDSQNMLAANGQIDSAGANQANALNSWNQGAIGANQATVQAGQLQDKNQQSQLDANLQKFQATDNAPWTRLGLLQSAASGSAGNYGTNVQTTKQSTNPLSMLGGIGSLATKA